MAAVEALRKRRRGGMLAIRRSVSSGYTSALELAAEWRGSRAPGNLEQLRRRGALTSVYRTVCNQGTGIAYATGLWCPSTSTARTPIMKLSFGKKGNETVVRLPTGITCVQSESSMLRQTT